jgi:hypothetical protein
LLSSLAALDTVKFTPPRETVFVVLVDDVSVCVVVVLSIVVWVVLLLSSDDTELSAPGGSLVVLDEDSFVLPLLPQEATRKGMIASRARMGNIFLRNLIACSFHHS